MWVRGLKLCRSNTLNRLLMSHPMWVRGLKHGSEGLRYAATRSHPMWVRGLKLRRPVWR